MPRRKPVPAHAYGSGSIFQRADGRFVARARIGEQIRYFYGKAEAEVRARLAEARQPAATAEPRTQTVAEYLRAWLEGARSDLAPSTAHVYGIYLERHILPQYGEGALPSLEARHLRELYAGLLAAGYAPATVKYVHRILRRALGDAVRERLLPRNPAEFVSPPRQVRYKAKTLSAAEGRLLLAGLVGDSLLPLVTLALHTGMRQGELLGLRWQDVDLDHAELNVSMSLQQIPLPPRLKETKTAGSQRTLPLSGLAGEALRLQKRLQLEARLLAGADWRGRETVFTDALGGYLRGTAVTDRLRRRLKRATLPSVRFHDLRHTTATLLHEEGLPIAAISQILGHGSARTTLDVYAHNTAAMHAHAKEILERLFGEG